MRTEVAIVESAFDQVFANVRAAHAALREIEVQAGKSAERAVKAQRIAEADREMVETRRRELGVLLLRARQAWPQRGPKAKGWGEFLEREGLTQPTAWRYMELAGGLEQGGPSAEVSFMNEIPHAAEGGDPATQPDPPRKPFGRVLDMQLLLGTWQDMLPDIGKVDVLITDAPYSDRVHKSQPTRNDGVDADGMTPNYDPWTAAHVKDFVGHWSPRTRGWMACMCDDELIPAYRHAYELVGRVAFAPVPCVIRGMSVRTRGDGPSSEAVYLMVARPAGKEFARWGTLPGAYYGPREEGAKHGRGKPRWLLDAIVQHYSRGNDLVCDPLAGYGVTLISALLQSRRAIGAEQDEASVTEAFARASASQEPKTTETP